MRIALKRIQEPVAAEDGYRVLVDRVWPRGIAKRDARLDDWRRDLAPSTELRKWFAHDRSRWPEFQRRYWAELELADSDVIADLRRKASDTGLTLLFAAHDTECNNAVVLKQYLEASDD